MKKIPSVKGTRDLYPAEYAPIRRIFDTWRETSLRHGFEEFEGPTLEMLELYREKSGEELVGQLYQLTDSGGRELALRPEMTPTLARMVAARINALSKPIKWFCIPKLFRGENVQRGRLREFFQWNIDVIGASDVVADAECILVGVEALRALGLTERDFAVHISNRRIIASLFAASGLAPEQHDGAYALLDKAAKMDADEWRRRWEESFGGQISYVALEEILQASDMAALRTAAHRVGGEDASLAAAMAETERLISLIQNFRILEFCKLDLRIVRGLAYYTGPVFEFLDRGGSERAICGGGRYDDLLGKLGKSPEPAVGFGMGDVVLSLMLEERGLNASDAKSGGVFVADAADDLRPQLHELVAVMRRAGIRAQFGYAKQSLGKQLKAADKRGCATVVILGDETRDRGEVQIKDMAAGQARHVSLAELLANPLAALGTGP